MIPYPLIDQAPEKTLEEPVQKTGSD